MFMKKIILLTISIGTILTFVIYKNFYHEDMNIVALGDNVALGQTAYNVKGYSYNDYVKDFYEDNSILKEYITEFISETETTETFLLKLQNNYTLESTNTSITQAISKAKILTIALGMDELNSKQELNSNHIEKYLQNMEKIIKMLRIYNKKNIFLISLYPTTKLSKEKVTAINKSLEEICKQYRVYFINITSILENKEYIFTDQSYYFNYKAHRYISEQIIDKIK